VIGRAGAGRAARSGRGPVGRTLLAAIGFYSRAVSPALPPRCRFAPTCSAYAAEAIAVHGAGRGSWLALRRLVKCAPWHPGGFDPVPPGRGTSPETDSAVPPAPRRATQQEAGVA
jgi:putative membrane protein insertion efficiency factor